MLKSIAVSKYLGTEYVTTKYLNNALVGPCEYASSGCEKWTHWSLNKEDIIDLFHNNFSPGRLQPEHRKLAHEL